MVRVFVLSLLVGLLFSCSSQKSDHVPAPSKTILRNEIAPLFSYPMNASELNAYKITFLPTFEIRRRLYLHRFTEGKWDLLVGVLNPGARAIEDKYAEAGPRYEYRVMDSPAKESTPLQIIFVSIDRGVMVRENSVVEVQSLPPRKIPRLLLQKNSKLWTLGLPRDLIVEELIADEGSRIEVGRFPKEEPDSVIKTGPFRLFLKRARGQLTVSPEFSREELPGDAPRHPDLRFGTQEMELDIEDDHELKFFYSMNPQFESVTGSDDWMTGLFSTYSRRCLLNLNHERWIILGGEKKKLAEVAGFYRAVEYEQARDGVYIPASGKGLAIITFRTDGNGWVIEPMGFPFSSLGEAKAVAPGVINFAYMYRDADVPFLGHHYPVFSESLYVPARQLTVYDKFKFEQMGRFVALHTEVNHLQEKLTEAGFSAELLLPEKWYSGPLEITEKHLDLLKSWVRDPKLVIDLLKTRKTKRLEIRLTRTLTESPGVMQWVVSEPIPWEFQ